MSCNGCRVLRKGCSDTCILRPCLQWIDGPEAQGHATVFVAKFFGRAGLMNFISAVPENQRPALFRSLLYEACGRTVNPVFGAVGLLWSGSWNINEAAVETVLKGGSLQPLIAALKPAQGTTMMPLNSAAAPGPMQAAAAMMMLPFQQQHLGKQENPINQQRDADVKPGVGVWKRSVKVKDEVSFTAAGFDNKRELLAPVPRRVRPREDSQVPYAFGGIDQQAVEPALDLDLTLGTHTLSEIKPQQKRQQMQQQQTSRVNSPCLSITSEGSVTSVSTGDDLGISLKQQQLSST